MSTKILVYATIVVAAVLRISLTASTHRLPSYDDSLFLTPLLDKNDIKTAQSLSHVNLGDCDSVLNSHAGYITVDRIRGNHLFFWHFQSKRNLHAPLLLWLNGGPTVSSMLGLFWKHGPLEAFQNQTSFSYTLRKYTWVGPFSVVYVDNPVGTGYSFSDSGEKGYKLTQAGYTEDLYNFVLQFFKMFPEYKTGAGFYISGQSYAGKYVPALAHRIHEEKHKGATDIPLTGVILGAPFFDPPTQSLAFSEYLYALGAFSFRDRESHKKNVREIYQKHLRGELSNTQFSELFYQVFVGENYLHLFSLDNYVTGKSAGYTFVNRIMSSPEIRKAVHVTTNRTYVTINTALYNLYGPDLFESTKTKLATLLDNYKVLLYNGDYDVVVSSVMLESALMSTNWSRQEEYSNSKRIIWADGRVLKGFFSQTGNFCRVVVHGAGHQTQHDKPETSLEMVTAFLDYGCISPKVCHPGNQSFCVHLNVDRVGSSTSRGLPVRTNDLLAAYQNMTCVLSTSSLSPRNRGDWRITFYLQLHLAIVIAPQLFKYITF